MVNEKEFHEQHGGLTPLAVFFFFLYHADGLAYEAQSLPSSLGFDSLKLF